MNAGNELTEKKFRRNEDFILKTCEALADYICVNKNSFWWKGSEGLEITFSSRNDTFYVDMAIAHHGILAEAVIDQNRKINSFVAKKWKDWSKADYRFDSKLVKKTAEYISQQLEKNINNIIKDFELKYGNRSYC